MNTELINIVFLFVTVLGSLISIMLFSNKMIINITRKINSKVLSAKNENIYREPSKSYLLFKRLFDIILSSISFIGISPLLLILTVTIKLNSNGPAFYVTHRIGVNGKTYRRYKFRTMAVNNITAENEIPKKEDYRLTKFGRFLRQTNLDELPAIINVLIGDISLVGRSNILDYYYTNQEIDQGVRAKLLKVKPGLVSLWVLSSDRQSFNLTRIQQFDIYYSNHCSFILDLEILVGTIILSFGTISKY